MGARRARPRQAGQQAAARAMHGQQKEGEHQQPCTQARADAHRAAAQHAPHSAQPPHSCAQACNPRTQAGVEAADVVQVDAALQREAVEDGRQRQVQQAAVLQRLGHRAAQQAEVAHRLGCGGRGRAGGGVGEAELPSHRCRAAWHAGPPGRRTSKRAPPLLLRCPPPRHRPHSAPCCRRRAGRAAAARGTAPAAPPPARWPAHPRAAPPPLPAPPPAAPARSAGAPPPRPRRPLPPLRPPPPPACRHCCRWARGCGARCPGCGAAARGTAACRTRAWGPALQGGQLERAFRAGARGSPAHLACRRATARAPRARACQRRPPAHRARCAWRQGRAIRPPRSPVPTSLKNSISSCVLAPAYSSNTLAALSSRRRREMRTCGRAGRGAGGQGHRVRQGRSGRCKGGGSCSPACLRGTAAASAP